MWGAGSLGLLTCGNSEQNPVGLEHGVSKGRELGFSGPPTPTTYLLWERSIPLSLRFCLPIWNVAKVTSWGPSLN